MGAVSAMSYHFDISILHVVRKEHAGNPEGLPEQQVV
jgi:hypothetical protein